MKTKSSFVSPGQLARNIKRGKLSKSTPCVPCYPSRPSTSSSENLLPTMNQAPSIEMEVHDITSTINTAPIGDGEQSEDAQEGGITKYLLLLVLY